MFYVLHSMYSYIVTFNQTSKSHFENLPCTPVYPTMRVINLPVSAIFSVERALSLCHDLLSSPWH